LLEMINNLSKEGYTFLKTTHYPDHAMMVSSRVVSMKDGAIIASGTPNEVITSNMITQLYGIDADIVHHKQSPLCVPSFSKGTL
jgi:iron complex transport system ATP-binding protein